MLADRIFLTLAWLLVLGLIICFWMLSKEDRTWNNRPGPFAVFFCYPLMGGLLVTLGFVHYHLLQVVNSSSHFLPG